MKCLLGLNDAERTKVNTFVTLHRKRHRGKLTATFTLTFQPTGLGHRIDVSCSCGKNADVSDYRSW